MLLHLISPHFLKHFKTNIDNMYLTSVSYLYVGKLSFIAITGVLLKKHTQKGRVKASYSR